MQPAQELLGADVRITNARTRKGPDKCIGDLYQICGGKWRYINESLSLVITDTPVYMRERGGGERGGIGLTRDISAVTHIAPSVSRT